MTILNKYLAAKRVIRKHSASATQVEPLLSQPTSVTIEKLFENFHDMH